MRTVSYEKSINIDFIETNENFYIKSVFNNYAQTKSVSDAEPILDASHGAKGGAKSGSVILLPIIKHNKAIYRLKSKSGKEYFRPITVSTTDKDGKSFSEKWYYEKLTPKRDTKNTNGEIESELPYPEQNLEKFYENEQAKYKKFLLKLFTKYLKHTKQEEQEVYKNQNDKLDLEKLIDNIKQATEIEDINNHLTNFFKKLHSKSSKGGASEDKLREFHNIANYLEALELIEEEIYSLDLVELGLLDDSKIDSTKYSSFVRAWKTFTSVFTLDENNLDLLPITLLLEDKDKSKSKKKKIETSSNENIGQPSELTIPQILEKLMKKEKAGLQTMFSYIQSVRVTLLSMKKSLEESKFSSSNQYYTKLKAMKYLINTLSSSLTYMNNTAFPITISADIGTASLGSTAQRAVIGSLLDTLFKARQTVPQKLKIIELLNIPDEIKKHIRQTVEAVYATDKSVEFNLNTEKNKETPNEVLVISIGGEKLLKIEGLGENSKSIHTDTEPFDLMKILSRQNSASVSASLLDSSSLEEAYSKQVEVEGFKLSLLSGANDKDSIVRGTYKLTHSAMPIIGNRGTTVVTFFAQLKPETDSKEITVGGQLLENFVNDLIDNPDLAKDIIGLSKDFLTFSSSEFSSQPSSLLENMSGYLYRLASVLKPLQTKLKQTPETPEKKEELRKEIAAQLKEFLLSTASVGIDKQLAKEFYNKYGFIPQNFQNLVLGQIAPALEYEYLPNKPTKGEKYLIEQKELIEVMKSVNMFFTNPNFGSNFSDRILHKGRYITLSQEDSKNIINQYLEQFQLHEHAATEAIKEYLKAVFPPNKEIVYSTIYEDLARLNFLLFLSNNYKLATTNSVESISVQPKTTSSSSKFIGIEAGNLTDILLSYAETIKKRGETDQKTKKTVSQPLPVFLTENDDKLILIDVKTSSSGAVDLPIVELDLNGNLVVHSLEFKTGKTTNVQIPHINSLVELLNGLRRIKIVQTAKGKGKLHRGHFLTAGIRKKPDRDPDTELGSPEQDTEPESPKLKELHGYIIKELEPKEIEQFISKKLSEKALTGKIAQFNPYVYYGTDSDRRTLLESQKLTSQSLESGEYGYIWQVGTAAKKFLINLTYKPEDSDTLGTVKDSASEVGDEDVEGREE